MAEGVGRKVANNVADGREVIYALEEGRHVDRHDAGHELSDGEEHGCQVYGKAGV